MNVAHQLGIKHAQYIASLRPANVMETCDLHDLYFPFVTNEWFGSDAMSDDYWTAFWVTLEDLSDEARN
jgi:hypothetical protein